MPSETWKVEYHEATTNQEFAKTQIAAKMVDTFSVNGDGVDGAKKAARKWLEDRAHTIRAMNVSTTKPRTLIAYVTPGSVAKAQAKNLAAVNAARKGSR